MNFKDFPEKEFDAVRYAAEDVNKLRRYLKSAFNKIEQCCAAEYPREMWGLSVAERTDDSMLIATPYGMSRLVAKMLCAEQPFARVEVQKQSLDAYDAVCWSTVWAFRVSLTGELSGGDANESPFKLEAFDSDKVEMQVSRVCLSMLYAIAKEP